MAAYVVRSAAAADAERLAALRWAWRVDERGESGLAWPDFAAGFARWWGAHPDHLAWLAAPDGEPSGAVGMCWLAVGDRVPGPEVWERRNGWLQSVYVRPAYRDRGVGAALVVAASEAARRLGLDYVAVHPSERSFPLYRRAGYAPAPGVLELRLGRR